MFVTRVYGVLVDRWGSVSPSSTLSQIQSSWPIIDTVSIEPMIKEVSPVYVIILWSKRKSWLAPKMFISFFFEFKWFKATEVSKIWSNAHWFLGRYFLAIVLWHIGVCKLYATGTVVCHLVQLPISPSSPPDASGREALLVRCAVRGKRWKVVALGICFWCQPKTTPTVSNQMLFLLPLFDVMPQLLLLLGLESKDGWEEKAWRGTEW